MATASTAPGAAPPPADPGSDAAARFGRHWWLALVLGILSIIVGIAALVFPGPTLLAVGILFGAYLIVWGVGLLYGAITTEGMGTGLRILNVILGLLALFIGVFLLVRPGESVLTAAWALGFWWLLVGVMQLIQGIAVKDGRAWNIIWGVIGIVAGLIILAQPGIGLLTLVVIVGVGLIVQGCIEIALAMAARKLSKEGAA